MSDYTQLKTDIANYLDRADLTNQIPSFISLAEIRMGRKLKVWWNTRLATYVIPASTTAEVDFPLPDRFSGMRTLRVNTNPILSLTYIQPEQMNNANLENLINNRTTSYTILADRLRVAPPPAEGVELQAVYYFNPSSLTDINSENAFTDNAYDMLLYTSLLEAKPYIKDTKRIQTWKGLYDIAYEDIMDDDNSFRWGESALVMTSDYNPDPSGTRVASG